MGFYKKHFIYFKFNFPGILYKISYKVDNVIKIRFCLLIEKELLQNSYFEKFCVCVNSHLDRLLLKEETNLKLKLADACA